MLDIRLENEWLPLEIYVHVLMSFGLKFEINVELCVILWLMCFYSYC